MAATAWSSRTRIVASPLALRLRLDDEATLRFVFNDWEGVAGVRSTWSHQVEAITRDAFREAVEHVARDAQYDRERRRKIPLALRGWPTMTAKPTGASGGGFPMRTITVPGDRSDPCPCIVTVGAPERWALLPNRIPGPQGPVRRDRVVAMFRHLQALNDRPGGARMLVVLHLLYGPRSPSADYLTFGDLAPIVHMTPTARDVTERASETEAFERAERFVPETAEDRDQLVTIKAGRDRSKASPRSAVDTALHSGVSTERKALRDKLSAEANQLRTRAINALRDVMGVAHARA